MSKRTACVTVLFLLLLQATNTLRSAYAVQTRISVYPTYIIPPGDNITVAVTVTNVMNLHGWQAAIEYNSSVIECSAAWVPEDDVFQGQGVLAEPVINAPTKDGLNCILIGALWISGSVSVSSGTLFKASFTGIENGETAIRIGTMENPIHPIMGDTPGGWYSMLLDPDANRISFIANNGVARVGSSNITVFPTNDLGLTFAEVTRAGSVFANKTSVIQAPPLADVVGQYYEIEVTASFVLNVTVRLAYDDSNMTQQQESNLRMMEYAAILGDIYPPFGKVDIIDIVSIAKAFGSSVGDSRYNPNADINGDGIINIRDIATAAKNFGKTSEWTDITTHVDTSNNIIYGETDHFSAIGIHSRE